MKEDCRPESGPISKPAGPRLDLLNRCIDRFGNGVGRYQCFRRSDWGVDRAAIIPKNLEYCGCIVVIIDHCSFDRGCAV